MSWFISLLLAGTVFTSSNNLSNYEYQNTSTNDLNTSKNTILDETERFEQSYPFNKNGKIEVSNLNGSIKIESWDKAEIKVIATKTANTKERLADVEINIDATQDSFRTKTDYKNSRNRGWSKDDRLSVEFELFVPRTAVLSKIESVNGSVDVSNMTNYTEVSAVNGSVKATNLRGTAKLSTVNGTVYADFDDLNDDSTISLGTVNGTVKLSIPSNANATVKANTMNGSISNEFGLPIRKGTYVGRDLYGKIGNGNVKIKLSSVNGGLSINNKDGGTTNPAVNLLPQKTSDDFDDSFDMDMDIEVGKMNVEIDKAMKDSKKALAEAKKEAAKAFDPAKVEEFRKEAEKIKIDTEKFKIDAKKFEAFDAEKVKAEFEKNKKQMEEDLVRASEAIYLSRRSPYIQEKTGSFEVEGIPNVVIKAEDCNVLVRGWDKQEVKYLISRIARSGIDAKDVKTKISNDKSAVEIEVINITSDSRLVDNDIVRVEVFVPKKSNLKVSTNREIRLEGVSGELELNGSNDSINVRDSYGHLKIDSADGVVRIIGFEGELDTKSVDGDVYLEGNFKKICSESNDGKVYLTLPDGANATLITNGTVDLENIKLKGEVTKNKGETKTLYVGKGGAEYSFDFADGKLIVRPKSSIIEN